MTTEYLYFELKNLNEMWFIWWDVLFNVKSTLLLQLGKRYTEMTCLRCNRSKTRSSMLLKIRSFKTNNSLLTPSCTSFGIVLDSGTTESINRVSSTVVLVICLVLLTVYLSTLSFYDDSFLQNPWQLPFGSTSEAWSAAFKPSTLPSVDCISFPSSRFIFVGLTTASRNSAGHSKYIPSYSLW